MKYQSQLRTSSESGILCKNRSIRTTPKNPIKKKEENVKRKYIPQNLKVYECFRARMRRV